MENYTNKQIRQAIKDDGADLVRHNADGSWDALWYKHPQNCASDGHYVFTGWTNTDVAEKMHID